jgi:DNA-directed RNA polymerase specialized sigma24 family protein
VKAKHYQVYVLHVIQGKPLREVCRVLGVNGATVYVIKHRLTRLLREIVRKLERESS